MSVALENDQRTTVKAEHADQPVNGSHAVYPAPPTPVVAVQTSVPLPACWSWPAAAAWVVTPPLARWSQPSAWPTDRPREVRCS